METNTRQRKILELIEENHIETQEELAARLIEAGYPAAQATISRDIRRLQLTKRSDKDGRSYYAYLGQDYEAGSNDRFSSVIRDAYLGTDRAMNMLVIHTVSGMAMAMATVLDDLDIPEILGCIAGDDTIMCATPSEKDAVKVMRKIKNMAV